jgi:hypothetical protein
MNGLVSSLVESDQHALQVLMEIVGHALWLQELG